MAAAAEEGQYSLPGDADAASTVADVLARRCMHIAHGLECSAWMLKHGVATSGARPRPVPKADLERTRL